MAPTQCSKFKTGIRIRKEADLINEVNVVLGARRAAGNCLVEVRGQRPARFRRPVARMATVALGTAVQ